MTRNLKSAAAKTNDLGKAAIILSIGLSYKIATSRSLDLDYGEHSLKLENQAKELIIQQQKLKEVTEEIDNVPLSEKSKNKLQQIEKDLRETEQKLDTIIESSTTSEPPNGEVIK